MRKPTGDVHHRESTTLPAEIAAQIALIADAAHEPLTFREMEILCWIARGKSDWEIGEILQISSKTVNFHVENAKRKFGVPTRVQAVLVAVWKRSERAGRPSADAERCVAETVGGVAVIPVIAALALQVASARCQALDEPTSTR
jgi:DNA-binding CsgD family transcriptional regulator